MDYLLRGDEPRTVRESVVDTILERIRVGELAPGTLLPPERELAVRFGVSRSTLREAIRVLDFVGVVEVRTRMGTYVADGALSKGRELRAHAALLGDVSPLDVMVARRSLEPTSARYAAINRHTRDVDALKMSLAKQRRLVASGGDTEVINRSFHLTVAIASRNPVLQMLFEKIAAVMDQRMWTELKRQARAKRQELYFEQHRAIADAIAAEDSSGATAAMLAHLDTIEEGMLAELE